MPRAILTFHGNFFLICHGQFLSFTDNFWPNLPRAILRVSRATFEILICHGQFSSFTGTFLRFATGNKKFHGGKKKHCPIPLYRVKILSGHFPRKQEISLKCLSHSYSPTPPPPRPVSEKCRQGGGITMIQTVPSKSFNVMIFSLVT